MSYTKIAAIYADSEALSGQTVSVGGWVRTIRDMKTFGFIELNDGSCFKNLQVVMEAGTLENYKDIAAQNVGAALIVTGVVTLTPDATNDKLTIAAKDTTYAAATQSVAGLMSAADKKSVDYCEALRLSMIGVPRYWRSTTLPANHVWANGDLVLFSDWPELKKVYDGGGFTGMLLAYNAASATIAANLGKWRPNAANPTGLYVPKLSDQFFRAWGQGIGREAGSSQTDTGRNATGAIDTATWMRDIPGVLYATKAGRAVSGTGIDDEYDCLNIDMARVWGEHAGTEFAPTHIRIPVVFYLGNSA